MSRQRIVRGAARLAAAAAFALASLNATAQIQPLFSHPLSGGARQALRPLPAAAETLRLLVAMIDFQEDADARTSGTGRFDLGTTARQLVDPPPHDRTYVLQHMAFAENYFRKCSDGKLIVRATVLDSIYRVPRKIQEYSPPRTSTTNAELGMLVNDAWQAVDAATPGFDFSAYDAFVIVHAGVGRDVDLTSIYGYDPTPYDIPSVYMGYAGLQNIFGQGYAGVPVSGGAFHIRNSIIIPETEDRDIETVSGTVTLELGINGLIVASIGSHLGLPDLFDTKTGRSGIGRFGLMDGQSIFSWGGVFPPEPSAWEKVFLGWVTPVTVPPGTSVYSLPAVSRSGGEDTIYRVPISAREYFLVENRNRDANRDGARVTIVQNGATVERVWSRDTSAGFNAFDQDSLYGVVTDVDEFDWSLPGGVNTRTGEWYEGGILIWHIDENVIDANLASDGVNADPDRRGVDLEEGDGSQDIGQSYGFLSPGQGSEDGTPFDFWYQGNPATPRVLSNVFSPSSHPSSLSNDLANSHITIRDFSLRGPVMQARIALGDSLIAPLPGFPKLLGRGVGKNSVTVDDVDRDGLQDFVVPTLSGDPCAPMEIFGWQLSGATILGDPAGVLAEGANFCAPQGLKIPAADLEHDGLVDFTSTGTHDVNSLRGWTVVDRNADLRADLLFTRTADRPGDDLAQAPLRGAPVISDSFIVGGGDAGILYSVARNPAFTLDSLVVFPRGRIVGIAVYGQPDTFVVAGNHGEIAIATPRTVVRSTTVDQSLAGSPAVGVMSPSLGKRVVVCDGSGVPTMLDGDLRLLWSGLPLVRMITPVILSLSPAIADIDGDGQKDVVVVFGNRIYAVNARGVPLDNFPVVTPEQHQLLASPVVADVDGNGTADILTVTQTGLVVAYDKSGRMSAGFPLQSGVNSGSTAAVFYMPGGCSGCTGIGLAVASDDGHLYGWKTGTLVTASGPLPEQPWPQEFHDAQNSGLDASTPAGSPCASCGQVSNAYNWPNPVRAEDGFRTRIRYYLTADAPVTVKIFDLAGDLVTRLEGEGRGGFDNEIEWDCSDIQSGIYFAHIDAQGAAAGSAVIKIAVVR